MFIIIVIFMKGGYLSKQVGEMKIREKTRRIMVGKQ